MRLQIQAAINKINGWYKRVRASGTPFADSNYLPNPSINIDPILVKDLVQADFNWRVSAGREKYGTYLQVEDGRDPLIDLYQELWDSIMYLRKELYRRYGK
jgi:hypothetical protein